jgi:ABC-2 type transport system permease protein
MDISLNMAGIKAMFRYSSKKLLLNHRWIVVALVSLLVALVMGYSATQSKGGLVDGNNLLDMLVLSLLLPIMSMVYGASMIRNELDDRSVTSVITSPIDRRVSYLGYYLALITVLALIMLIITVVGWSSYFFLTRVDSGAANLLIVYSSVLIFGAVIYSSLFLAMGAVLKQPIYLGLLYAFVWEGFIGSVPGAIGDFTIRHQLRVISSSMIDDKAITNVSGDLTASVLMLIGVAAFLLIAGAFVFREMEVP